MATSIRNAGLPKIKKDAKNNDLFFRCLHSRNELHVLYVVEEDVFCGR